MFHESTRESGQSETAETSHVSLKMENGFKFIVVQATLLHLDVMKYLARQETQLHHSDISGDF